MAEGRARAPAGLSNGAAEYESQRFPKRNPHGKRAPTRATGQPAALAAFCYGVNAMEKDESDPDLDTLNQEIVPLLNEPVAASTPAG